MMKHVFTRIVALCAVLLMLEGSLRMAGIKPFTPQQFANTSNPSMKRDPVIGWSANPGEYIQRIPAGDGSGFSVRILEDGSRKTSEQVTPPKSSIFLLGGSFFQGFGLSDEATLGWKLAEVLEGCSVKNYAVGGWGAYQSLLKLEQLLSSENIPTLVVYGLITHHEMRDSGAAEWQRGLAGMSSTGNSFLPYCRLKDEKRCIRIPPKKLYPVWPLREYSSLVSILERLYALLPLKLHRTEPRKTTQQVLLEMAETLEDHGSKLLVVSLDLSPEIYKEYEGFAKENGLSVIQCAHPEREKKKFQLSGNVHPNERVQQYWLDCLLLEVQRLAPGCS